jgi:hypothetical protein
LDEEAQHLNETQMDEEAQHFDEKVAQNVDKMQMKRQLDDRARHESWMKGNWMINVDEKFMNEMAQNLAKTQMDEEAQNLNQPQMDEQTENLDE